MLVISLDFRVCDLLLLLLSLQMRTFCNHIHTCVRLNTALLYPIRCGHHFGLESILAERRSDQRVIMAVWTEQADAQWRKMREWRMMADRTAGGDALVTAAAQRGVTLQKIKIGTFNERCVGVL